MKAYLLVPRPLQINCVVMKGLNDDEICDFVAMTQDKVTTPRGRKGQPLTASSEGVGDPPVGAKGGW